MLKLAKSSPFEEDVEKATNENNLSEDWSLIMHICDNAINYQDGAKFCLKAIMKRLHHNVPRVVLQTLTLLDACVKNCDRRFLLQIASMEFTNEVRKLLGKMHPEAEKKLKLLLQKWSMEEFKDDPELGIIPSLYYKLKSEGVEFPTESEKKPAAPVCTDPDAVTSQEEENDIIKAIEISLKDTGRYDISSELGTSNHDPSNSGLPSSKPLPEPIKVRAMYDFDAAEDNELTIKAGEIVMVLDNSNSSWWKGSNHRGEGLFPANFVTEDLDYKPEDTPSLIAESVADTESDSTFVGEVKIDEAKIETLINWLNDTDPASEVSDSAEMLRLEDEVHKMAPLIEDNLQSVDKRIAMLSLVNEKIMTAFDLFHSLSDNWSALPPNMKYATIPVSQPQASIATVASTVYQTMQPFPNQQMMYVPAPSSGPQYVTAGDQAVTRPVFAAQMQPQPYPSQGQISATPVQQPLATDNSSADKGTNVTNSVPTSTSQVVYPPVLMNPYHPNPMGGFFVPPGMPIPFQYPPNQPNMQPQGFMPTPGATPNAMNIPYPVQSMGPYIPFPYYYVNSNPAVPQNSIPTSVSQTPDQESVKMPSSTIATTESNTVATAASSFPSYSSDLQTMNFATIPSSKEQNGILTDSTALSTVDLNAHTESVQGSK